MKTAREKLDEIKSDLKKIGLEMLRERGEMKFDEATEILEPFVKIEKQIDRIIKERRKATAISNEMDSY